MIRPPQMRTSGTGGGTLAPTRGSEPEPEHQAVLANLYDIQARLRGDPASLVPPRGRARITGPRAAVAAPEDLAAAAEARVVALRARLDQLEAELESVVRALRREQRGA
jgi:hypothetical protein